MSRACKYPWDRLVHTGDHVLVDTPLSARSIGVSASAFVRNKLGPGALVRTTKTPEGVVVFLAYAPPTQEVETLHEESVADLPILQDVVEDDADVQESEDE